MSDAYALIVKTSLPNSAFSKDDLKITVQGFSNFELAKEGLRKVFNEFAFSNNNMFDGKGVIKELHLYTKDALEDDEEFGKALSKVEKCLKSIFKMKDVDLDELEEVDQMTDFMIEIEFNDEDLKIIGADEGMFNGYNPFIKTNMFNIEEGKNYYLYIDDMLGQGASCELYIDLVKVNF